MEKPIPIELTEKEKYSVRMGLLVYTAQVKRAATVEKDPAVKVLREKHLEELRVLALKI